MKVKTQEIMCGRLCAALFHGAHICCERASVNERKRNTENFYEWMHFLSNGQQLTRNIIRQTDVWMHNGRHSYSNAGFFFFCAIIADGSQSKLINSGFLCMPHSCVCVAVDEWTTLCVEVESVGTADTIFESSSNVDFLSDYLVARASHFRFVFFLVSFVSLYPIRYERCFDHKHAIVCARTGDFHTIEWQNLNMRALESIWCDREKDDN